MWWIIAGIVFVVLAEGLLKLTSDEPEEDLEPPQKSISWKWLGAGLLGGVLLDRTLLKRKHDDKR